MKKHHTKEKGDFGVLKAHLDLFEKGYLVLNPLTEHAPFDLVAYKDGKFERVQVKYRTVTKTGTIEIKFSSSWADTKGTHTSPVDKSEVDLYCIYCPDTDKCYYLRPQNFNKAVALRVGVPKNGQTGLVHFADNFIEIPE